MTTREQMYIEKYDSEFLTIKQACEIWKKPGYSTLSKLLPQLGYDTAVQRGIIPTYKKVGNTYLLRIRDILEFLENTN